MMRFKKKLCLLQRCYVQLYYLLKINTISMLKILFSFIFFAIVIISTHSGVKKYMEGKAYTLLTDHLIIWLTTQV